MQASWDERQLSMLGIVFTAAKLLFLQGRLDACQALCHLLAPAAASSWAALHTTSIRNETAFLIYISRLEADDTRLIRSPQAAPLPYVYVLGDSHCLAGSPARPVCSSPEW